MKNFLKSKFGTILVLIATVALAGIAIFTAFRLYKLRQEAVAPNAPTSKPAAATCTQQCPGSDGVLRNCTPPDSDGTSQDSICNSNVVGRIEPCGGTSYCCNGTKWTTSMTACQTTLSPTPTPNSSCETLSFTINETPTPTGSSTATPTTTATSTPTASSTATSSPTIAPTGTSSEAQAALPEAGTSLPSILGLGIGGILLLISLFLAL